MIFVQEDEVGSPVMAEGRLEAVEVRLLDISFYAILAAKATGNFPLTIQNRRLHYKRFNAATLFALVLLAAGVVCAKLQYQFSKFVSSVMSLRTPTDKVAMGMLTYAVTIIYQGFPIYSLCTRRRILACWQENVRLLDKLSQTLGLSLKESEFQELWQSLRQQVIGVWLFTAFTTVLGVFHIHGAGPETPAHIFTIFFWCYTIFLHTGFNVWVTFYPRVYAICFRLIRKELRKISLPSKLSGSSPTSTAPPVGVPLHLSPIPRLKRLKPKHENKKLAWEHFDDAAESVVKNCVESYLAVDDRVKSYNQNFGIVLLFNVLMDILILLIYVFFFFVWCQRGLVSNGVGTIGPICLFSIDLHWFGTVAEELKYEAQNIQNVLIHLPLERLSPKLRSQVQMMALRITSTPPRIQPCGYFTFSRGLLTSIISATTMYLIVLVQFENADDGFE